MPKDMNASERRRAYREKVKARLERIERLEDDAVRDVIRIVRGLQDDVKAKLLQPTAPWEAGNLANLERALAQSVFDFQKKFVQMMGLAVEQSWERGQQTAIEPLIEVGLDVRLPSLSPRELELMQATSADLVQDLAIDTYTKIDTEIRRVVVGFKSQFDAARDIEKLLALERAEGRRVGIAGALGYQAERIVRTEVNRVHNVASFDSLKQAQNDLLDLEKTWVATLDGRTRDSHRELHGMTLPMHEPFPNGLMYPHDPSGPPEETVHCRCRLVAHRQSWKKPSPSGSVTEIAGQVEDALAEIFG